MNSHSVATLFDPESTIVKIRTFKKKTTKEEKRDYEKESERMREGKE
jgi:hypothetical protein